MGFPCPHCRLCTTGPGVIDEFNAENPAAGGCTMISIQRHALVRHSAARMYGLVNDVASYPRRFPWCEAAQVLEQSEQSMLAKLDIRVAGVRVSFTTRNALIAPTRIELQLVEGPFRRLRGTWVFHTLSEDACKVSLSLEFEVASKLVGSALAIGFQGLADRMVDDFCRQADVADD
jgi:ribosome-associated toxin RatA of RatAB toxin-antitoxin module